ncbi:MAG: phosphatidate cytidylyltransferase [Chloroflexi bacterium]|nr:phosphatidate cytidylyltransferase [Chloroflexota bacterium]MBU1750292.1 phosphatidate cytidylyltransferase [Chloroflexota bacterium]MBU1877869.1 phosphatidate cytidylyltransferase [Chloroflexota bacterium]
MLRTRVLSAIVLIPVVLALAWLGGLGFLLLIGVFALLGSIEFAQMMRHGNHQTLWFVSIPVALALVGLAYLNVPLAGTGVLIAGATLLALGFLTLRQDLTGTLTDWALTVAGALYLGLPMSYFVYLRALPNGPIHAATQGLIPDGLAWLAAGVLPVWACDTGAYLVGRAIGRRPFFRHVSPKKTLEGAIGGLVAGTVVAAVILTLLGQPIWHGLVVGVLLTVAAIFGDLAESLIKRQVGVKDSGRLIPGHGGVLDRLDSLLFAVVVLYWYVMLFVHPT